MQNLPSILWPSSRLAGWVLLAVLLVFRFWHLEADPSFLKAIADIDDEAWWAAPALHYLKTGSFLLHNQSGGFLLAPAYSFLLLAWFKIAGANLVSIHVFHLVFFMLTCLGIYQYLGKGNPNRIWILALFLSNFFFFDFSRIGFPENVQMALLIWLLLACKKWFQQPSLILSSSIGFLLGLIILVKVSIVWLLPAFMAGVWYARPGEVKIPRVAVVPLWLVPAVLVGLYFIGFYWPYRESFVQQSQWMALTFPNLTETLNLRRIAFWLFHFIQVPFFQNPSIFLGCGLVLLKWKQEGWNPGAYLVTILGLVVLNLLGDGSERRLVFFLLPLVLILGQAPASHFKPLPAWMRLILLVFMGGNVYYFLFEHGEPWNFGGLTTPVTLVFCLVLFAGLGFNLFRKRRLSSTDLVGQFFTIFYFVFSFLWCWSSLQSFFQSFPLPVFNPNLIPCLALVWALVLGGAWFGNRVWFRYVFGLCLVVGLVLQGYYHFNPGYHRKSLGQKLRPLLEKQVVAGPNLAFGMHVYGNFTPLYHSDISPGYESIYVPEWRVADFYLEVYPAFGKPHDPLVAVSELVNVGKSVEEVFRDSLYHGANRQVVVVYDLRTPARWDN